jgi:glutaredoxin-like protein NrdH
MEEKKNNQAKGNQMDRCNVKLYALSTCGHCKDTKAFLNECHIKYDCVDVDKLDSEERKKVLEEIRTINPQCAFPTIVIGDKVIVGFREDKIKEALKIK